MSTPHSSVRDFLVVACGYWTAPGYRLHAWLISGGLALINCLGLTGGFVSPFLLGWIRNATGSLTPGLWFMTGLMLTGIVVLLLATRRPFTRVAPHPANSRLSFGPEAGR